mmetsp:Transcript_24584/g.29004  ORF Transcript_24584/g.29004 Transcript_24584/m.29004 type:complete len:91 (+) Transcript_24584:141-413(+)
MDTLQKSGLSRKVEGFGIIVRIFVRMLLSTSTRSIMNLKCEFAGMEGWPEDLTSLSPYPSEGGTISSRFPPAFIVSSASVHPLMMGALPY